MDPEVDFIKSIEKTVQQSVNIAVVSVEWDVVDLIESIPHLKVAGFFDPILNNNLSEFSYFGDDHAWEKIKRIEPDLKVALAIDFPKQRARLFELYGKDAILTLISPHSYISSRASIGFGTIVQRGVTIMANACLGRACKINVNATIHHDVKIGHFSTLAPSSLILGNVILEDEVYVGAGAIIRQRCHIGKGATIGAGAVVVRDVPPGATVVGVPANRRLDPSFFEK